MTNDDPDQHEPEPTPDDKKSDPQSDHDNGAVLRTLNRGQKKPQPAQSVDEDDTSGTTDDDDTVLAEMNDGKD